MGQKCYNQCHKWQRNNIICSWISRISGITKISLTVANCGIILEYIYAYFFKNIIFISNLLKFFSFTKCPGMLKGWQSVWLCKIPQLYMNVLQFMSSCRISLLLQVLVSVRHCTIPPYSGFEVSPLQSLIWYEWHLIPKYKIWYAST